MFSDYGLSLPWEPSQGELLRSSYCVEWISWIFRRRPDGHQYSPRYWNYSIKASIDLCWAASIDCILMHTTWIIDTVLEQIVNTWNPLYWALHNGNIQSMCIWYTRVSWLHHLFSLHICNLSTMYPPIILNPLARRLHPWLLQLYLCLYQPPYASDNLNCIIIRDESDAFVWLVWWKHWAWEAYQCLLTQYAPLSAACGTNLKVKSSIYGQTCNSFKHCFLMVSSKANRTVKFSPLKKDNKWISTAWPTEQPLIAHGGV